MTGYTLILKHEPCLMCSMALVHLRVRWVIYLYKNSFDQGYLNNENNLMSYKINHHYDVF